MLTKEDLQLLSEMFDQKLDQKLAPINEHLEKIDERLDDLEYDVNIIKGATNALTAWAEAATEYYMPKIHFPLKSDEKIS